MKYLRFCFVLVLGLALALGDAAAQDTPVDSLRLAHAAAAERVAGLATARDAAGAWAEEQYRLIPEARELDTNTLRQALAAAQFAADSLDVLDALLADAVAVERATRQALIVALESELASTLSAAELAAPIERAVLGGRARSLADELAGLRQPLALPSTELPALTVEPSDGPEEIALKADFLNDRAAQLRSAADVVATEISRAERRGRLHEEMRRLVAEVQLFDEAGLPPVGAQGDEGAAQNATGEQFDVIASDPTRAPTIGDLPVNPRGERALDLPILPVEGGLQPRDGESVAEQLERLRQDLLRRAEALDRQAEEFRRLLRGPP